METYRSGHNGADSKSVREQSPASSNLAVSAKKSKSQDLDFFIQAASLVCNHAFACMSSPQVYFLQLDDIQHFVLLTFRLTMDYMHGFAVILPQGWTYCHRTCFFAFAINVTVNVGSCSHITMTEPVMNHFHRHTVWSNSDAQLCRRSWKLFLF